MTIKAALLAIPLLLMGWVGVLAGLTLLSDDAPAALVLFPSQDFLAQMPEGAAMLAATPISVTLASDNSNFALQLYKNGAWLVLPAGLRGCTARL